MTTTSPLVLISTATIVLLVIAVLLIAGVIALYFFGRKQQKKMEESQAQIEANSQQVTMLVIDKKKLRLKDANLPQIVVDSTPKLARLSKVPIVKAKVGPRVMNLVADTEIYDMIPIKQEIKATVSGIYITKVRSLRGPALVKPAKKKFRQKLMDKVKSAASTDNTSSKNKKK